MKENSNLNDLCTILLAMGKLCKKKRYGNFQILVEVAISRIKKVAMDFYVTLKPDVDSMSGINY